MSDNRENMSWCCNLGEHSCCRPESIGCVCHCHNPPSSIKEEPKILQFDARRSPTAAIELKLDNTKNIYRSDIKIRCDCGYDLLCVIDNDRKPEDKFSNVTLMIGASKMVLRCPKCKEDREIVTRSDE